MKAVVFNGKELSLKYDENYPMPKIINDTDVIVKVEYSGVCGTDLHIIQVRKYIFLASHFIPSGVARGNGAPNATVFCITFILSATFIYLFFSVSSTLCS